MSFAFPRSCKIVTKKQYRSIRCSGLSFTGGLLKISYKRSAIAQKKMGITVSKSYGNACRRNRFKRLMREIFRLNRELLPDGTEFDVSPLTKIEKISLNVLSQEFQLFAKGLSKNKLNI